MYRRYVLPVLIFLAAGCHTGSAPETKLLKSQGRAVSPYLTTDEHGNAVLCWTEMDARDSAFTLKFAKYQPASNSFGPAITVSGSGGAQTAAESMNKIAFKSDGSIVAVFGKKFPHENNPYAGAIYFSMSSDQGRTWTDPEFLHSDTAHSYGRSFFDVSKLRNGEVGAVWLDGRLGKSEKGSALYFSRTEPGKGFGADKLVDKSTCECCRTALLTDGKGNLHVAYRKIMYPPEKLGKGVRDMAYAVSPDNGTRFSPPSLISQDGWVLDGCPHTGPAMAMTRKGPAAIWFTAGGQPGLYFSDISAGGGRSRSLLTRTGRHPQVVTSANGRLAAIWEESGEARPMKDGTGHHGRHDQAGTGIVVSTVAGGEVGETLFRISGAIPRSHPVLLSTQYGLLAAWVAETDGGPRIEYACLGTDIGH